MAACLTVVGVGCGKGFDCHVCGVMQDWSFQRHRLEDYIDNGSNAHFPFVIC